MRNGSLAIDSTSSKKGCNVKFLWLLQSFIDVLTRAFQMMNIDFCNPYR